MTQTNCHVPVKQHISNIEQAQNARSTNRNSGLIWLQSGLKFISNALLNVLVISRDPHISYYRDRHGNESFRVYDPVDDSHHQFANENSLRIWLEERHKR